MSESFARETLNQIKEKLEMSNDLVKRLRGGWPTIQNSEWRKDTDMKKVEAERSEAADRIEALELALTQSRAETAAAYERAAECIECAPKRMRLVDIEAIRALATPEQSAALDAIKAETRAQGMREAAEICMSLETESNRPARCAKDILAAIQKGEPK